MYCMEYLEENLTDWLADELEVRLACFLRLPALRTICQYQMLQECSNCTLHPPCDC
jgi:hypothetical protein